MIYDALISWVRVISLTGQNLNSKVKLGFNVLQKTEWKNVKYSYNLGRLQGSVNTDKVTRWIPGGGKIIYWLN